MGMGGRVGKMNSTSRQARAVGSDGLLGLVVVRPRKAIDELALRSQGDGEIKRLQKAVDTPDFRRSESRFSRTQSLEKIYVTRTMRRLNHLSNYEKVYIIF